MSIKKKLAMGIATGALAVSMIGGGTFAYFNDVETSGNTFAAGTLDLSLNPETIIDVTNIKPGDWMTKSFTLKNDGSLDIAKVLLKTDYEVINKIDEAANTKDFGEDIRVNFMLNSDKVSLPVIWTTLAELKEMTPDAVANLYFPNWTEEAGLKPGNSDELVVQFQFVDEGDQNQFQGDSLKLTWEFEAKQGVGVEIQ